MIIVFVAKDFSRFSALATRLRREQEIELVPVATGQAALDQVKERCPDLVIADEQLDDMSGIAFVEQLVRVNPMINTALVGSLEQEAFHEATEGLGVLMQIPVQPTEEDAEKLLRVLANIGALMPKPADQRGPSC